MSCRENYIIYDIFNILHAKIVLFFLLVLSGNPSILTKRGDVENPRAENFIEHNGWLISRRKNSEVWNIPKPSRDRDAENLRFHQQFRNNLVFLAKYQNPTYYFDFKCDSLLFSSSSKETLNRSISDGFHRSTNRVWSDLHLVYELLGRKYGVNCRLSNRTAHVM